MDKKVIRKKDKCEVNDVTKIELYNGYIKYLMFSLFSFCHCIASQPLGNVEINYDRIMTGYRIMREILLFSS